MENLQPEFMQNGIDSLRQSGEFLMTGVVGSNMPPVDFNSSALLPESADEFSMTPYEFEESAKILWEDLQLTYHHACTANRFTDDYLKLCGRLEKSIKQIGSLCITKAVLEQNGLVFPDLRKMNIAELLGMVSFHLRKCHAAFRTIYQQNDFLGMSYLNREFRWVELGSRLKATDVKIQNILSGKVNAEKILKREEVKKRSSDDVSNAAALPQNLPVNPAALPINGSLAREMLRRQKTVEKQEDEKQKMIDGLYAIWGRKSQIFSDLEAVQPALVFPLIQKENGKSKNIFLSADEARKIMMKDARERGDQRALSEISLESDEQLNNRWIAYIETSLPPD